MSIFEEAIEKVGNGASFSVDFESRSLKIDGKYVIKNGEYEGELGTEIWAGEGMHSVLCHIEVLYGKYKHSRPSERSNKRKKLHFKALRGEDLLNEDFVYGEDRELAMLNLELFILCLVIQGTFKWSDDIPENFYFWQSNSDKDLVIFRSWIVQENK